MQIPGFTIVKFEAMKKINLIIGIIFLGSLIAKGQTTETGFKINITKLTAHEKNNRVFIEWTADAGNESNYWEVQGSADGKDFHTIALVLGFDPGKKGEQYSFKGKITRPENIFYRVAHISLTGNDIQQSNMIKVEKQGSYSASTPQKQ